MKPNRDFESKPSSSQIKGEENDQGSDDDITFLDHIRTNRAHKLRMPSMSISLDDSNMDNSEPCSSKKGSSTGPMNNGFLINSLYLNKLSN